MNSIFKLPPPDGRILPGDIVCENPPTISNNSQLDHIVGSLVGLAIGDALGASMEFRPREYLLQYPVRDMQGGGTWGLRAGQWTDDTSMALCLASSLITSHGFDPYNQMVMYKWWYKKGFLSSTGTCFDIGNATAHALTEFISRQTKLKEYFRTHDDSVIDHLNYEKVKAVPGFDPICGDQNHAGNGPLMRLAPVPLFYFRQPKDAVRYAGLSAALTHGDPRAIDACRYYAALIVAAIRGEAKKDILDERFYEKHQIWFDSKPLHADVLHVATGSFKRKANYEQGIRGKNFIVNTLEAALWAFYNDNDSFEKGACDAVNLGDDTDTTAAVYGQLAGAYYGMSKLPPRWQEKLYAMNFIIRVSRWIYFEGERSFSGTSSLQHMTHRNDHLQQQNKQMNSKSENVVVSMKRDDIVYDTTSSYPSARGFQQSQATSHHYGSSKKDKKDDPSKLPAAGIPSQHHSQNSLW